MNDILWQLVPWSSLGLLFVLLLRRPLRRAFGASPAFALWALPPLFCLLPWLPATSLPTTLPLLRVMPLDTSALTTDTPVAMTTFGLGTLWLVGVIACAARLLVCYTRLLRQGRQLDVATRTALLPILQGFSPQRIRIADQGPAVLWALRPRLLLPADFLQRFDADERACVLRHELTHLRRGDAWWSLIAELMLALLWFHPLAWLALPRFRLDQELACDERSLRDAPEQRSQYAHTLLHSTGMSFAPAITPWLNQPQLKERLLMIQQVAFSVSRRRIGYVVLALLMSSSVMVAQAAAQQPVRGATADLQFNQKIVPAYPKESVLNKEHGLVMLEILVDPQGSVKTINYNPQHSTTTSTALIKAASDAAAQWHFTPAKRNGKAVESYAWVPVQFDLNDMPTAPASSKS
jgi:TonB family protein